MAHHKRRRPKSSRAGCLLCKPHKHQGVKNRPTSQPLRVRRILAGEKADGRRGHEAA